MVLVARVGLGAQHDHARRDEARQIVDVPVRVVARDAAPEPQHALGAELGLQDALELRRRQLRDCAPAPCPAGTPPSRAACPRRRRRRRRPRAPRARRSASTRRHLDARRARDRRRHLDVELPVVVLGPRVEAPVRRALLRRRASRTAGRCRASTSDWSPRARDPNCPPRRRARASRALPSRRRHSTPGCARARAAPEAHELAVHPANRRELPRPISLVVRPRDPGRRVARPLRGHACSISRFRRESGW